MTQSLDNSVNAGVDVPVQRIVDLSPDAVFFHAFDGQFLYVNDAACSILGYTREELLSLCPWDFVVNDSQEYIRSLWDSMESNIPVQVEGEFRRKDGALIPTEVRLVRLNLGKRNFIAAYCRDVSERRSSESALLGEERSRIARDVHDTLAHALTAIAVQLEAAKHARGADPGAGGSHVNNALQIARDGLRDLREFVRAIRPASVESSNLVEAIRQLVSSRSVGRPEKLQFRLDGQARALSPKVDTHLLRIAQEALANVLKHARAKHVQIELSYSVEDVRITIQDDGRGFDAHEARAEGMGLSGIRERAEDMGGKLQIETGDQGTTVTVVVRSATAETGNS